MIGNLILSLHHKEGYFHHGTSNKILLCFSKPQFSDFLPGSTSVPNSQIVNILEACTSRGSVKVNSFIKKSIFRICLCHYSDHVSMLDHCATLVGQAKYHFFSGCKNGRAQYTLGIEVQNIQQQR